MRSLVRDNASGVEARNVAEGSHGNSARPSRFDPRPWRPQFSNVSSYIQLSLDTLDTLLDTGYSWIFAGLAALVGHEGRWVTLAG